MNINFCDSMKNLNAIDVTTMNIPELTSAIQETFGMETTIKRWYPAEAEKIIGEMHDLKARMMEERRRKLGL